MILLKFNKIYYLRSSSILSAVLAVIAKLPSAALTVIDKFLYAVSYLFSLLSRMYTDFAFFVYELCLKVVSLPDSIVSAVYRFFDVITSFINFIINTFNFYFLIFFDKISFIFTEAFLENCVNFGLDVLYFLFIAFCVGLYLLFVRDAFRYYCQKVVPTKHPYYYAKRGPLVWFFYEFCTAPSWGYLLWNYKENLIMGVWGMIMLFIYIIHVEILVQIEFLRRYLRNPYRVKRDFDSKKKQFKIFISNKQRAIHSFFYSFTQLFFNIKILVKDASKNFCIFLIKKIYYGLLYIITWIPHSEKILRATPIAFYRILGPFYFIIKNSPFFFVVSIKWFYNFIILKFFSFLIFLQISYSSLFFCFYLFCCLFVIYCFWLLFQSIATRLIFILIRNFGYSFPRMTITSLPMVQHQAKKAFSRTSRYLTVPLSVRLKSSVGTQLANYRRADFLFERPLTGRPVHDITRIQQPRDKSYHYSISFGIQYHLYSPTIEQFPLLRARLEELRRSPSLIGRRSKGVNGLFIGQILFPKILATKMSNSSFLSKQIILKNVIKKNANIFNKFDKTFLVSRRRLSFLIKNNQYKDSFLENKSLFSKLMFYNETQPSVRFFDSFSKNYLPITLARFVRRWYSPSFLFHRNSSFSFLYDKKQTAASTYNMEFSQYLVSSDLFSIKQDTSVLYKPNISSIFLKKKKRLLHRFWTKKVVNKKKQIRHVVNPVFCSSSESNYLSLRLSKVVYSRFVKKKKIDFSNVINRFKMSPSVFGSGSFIFGDLSSQLFNTKRFLFYIRKFKLKPFRSYNKKIYKKLSERFTFTPFLPKKKKYSHFHYRFSNKNLCIARSLFNYNYRFLLKLKLLYTEDKFIPLTLLKSMPWWETHSNLMITNKMNTFRGDLLPHASKKMTYNPLYTNNLDLLKTRFIYATKKTSKHYALRLPDINFLYRYRFPRNAGRFAHFLNYGSHHLRNEFVSTWYGYSYHDRRLRMKKKVYHNASTLYGHLIYQFNYAAKTHGVGFLPFGNFDLRRLFGLKRLRISRDFSYRKTIDSYTLSNLRRNKLWSLKNSVDAKKYISSVYQFSNDRGSSKLHWGSMNFLSFDNVYICFTFCFFIVIYFAPFINVFLKTA